MQIFFICFKKVHQHIHQLCNNLLLSVSSQSDLYNEKRKGDKTVPWGGPVLVIITSDDIEGLNVKY